jgi:dehydrogenase/reductase SDR family protein 4
MSSAAASASAAFSVGVSSSGGKLRWAEGKVALVTGATKGIGYAIAERLARSGAHVVLCSRSQRNVDEAVASLKAQGIQGTGLAIHVGNDEARAKLVSAAAAIAGRIDILVSNVAVNPVFGPMLAVTSSSAWDKIFDVNVKSHFFLVKECLPHMRPGSAVLIVSSYAGYTPNPLLGAYSVSKTALIALTKVLGTELAAKQIRVNCVAPGIIKTKFSELLWKDDPTGGASGGSGDNSNPLVIPLQRYGEPDEVGALACFLCSDDASYITGETVVVGGGVMSRL